MKYRIEINKKAQKFIKSQPRNQQERLLAAIYKLPEGDVKALAGLKDYDDICVTLEDGTKKRVILSHFFIPMYNGHRYQAIHLHAHSHFTDEADYEIDFAEELNRKGCKNEIYNVGCMYWNYEPVTLDEIITHGRTIRPNYGERTIESEME